MASILEANIQLLNIVRSFRQEGKTTPFLSRVLDGIDGSLGRPLTVSGLAEECMGGMFGGSGTTANTFVSMLWGTLRHPDVVRNLKEELRNAFPDPDAIPSAMECAKLPYLNAVLQETLRLYPTINAILPRMAVQDTILGGFRIPKGSQKASTPKGGYKPMIPREQPSSRSQLGRGNA
ncbi:hypothetical protein N7507_010047 [Penicillium longicatenatum]|nr:hypothetical protein N7507_010047 [Penicillium longicatenatum]